MNYQTLVVVVLLGAPSCLALGTDCKFSRDCDTHPPCVGIQDAGCACNFGHCNITGGYFFRSPDFRGECSTYEDCDCRENKANCFCKYQFCQTEEWECHESSDCVELAKCSGKACTCSGNTCEFDCSTDDDCEEHSCNTNLGYKCKCEDSLCTFERKPEECTKIEDCVAKGLCQSDEPCDCVQGFCTKPWWIGSDRPQLNCRSAQDCIDTILDCQDPSLDCPCRDVEQVTDWEKKGTCSIEPIPPPPYEPPCVFSPDCYTRQSCRSLADAGCACNFGNCNITGGYFFRTPDFRPECTTFQDCDCRGDRENCFCRSGICSKARWECHDSNDCKQLDKCRDKNCGCSGSNTCEWECDSASDCVENATRQCNTTPGYRCRCENSQCDFEKVPEDKPVIFA